MAMSSNKLSSNVSIIIQKEEKIKYKKPYVVIKDNKKTRSFGPFKSLFLSNENVPENFCAKLLESVDFIMNSQTIFIFDDNDATSSKAISLSMNVFKNICNSALNYYHKNKETKEVIVQVRSGKTDFSKVYDTFPYGLGSSDKDKPKEDSFQNFLSFMGSEEITTVIEDIHDLEFFIDVSSKGNKLLCENSSFLSNFYILEIIEIENDIEESLKTSQWIISNVNKSEFKTFDGDITCINAIIDDKSLSSNNKLFLNWFMDEIDNTSSHFLIDMSNSSDIQYLKNVEFILQKKRLNQKSEDGIEELIAKLVERKDYHEKLCQLENKSKDLNKYKEILNKAKTSLRQYEKNILYRKKVLEKIIKHCI